jgi:hypothetical protein
MCSGIHKLNAIDSRSNKPNIVSEVHPRPVSTWSASARAADVEVSSWYQLHPPNKLLDGKTDDCLSTCQVALGMDAEYEIVSASGRHYSLPCLSVAVGVVAQGSVRATGALPWTLPRLARVSPPGSSPPPFLRTTSIHDFTSTTFILIAARILLLARGLCFSAALASLDRPLPLSFNPT